MEKRRRHMKNLWYKYYFQCSQLDPYLGILKETNFQNWVLIESLFSLDIHLLASTLKWDWNWWLLKPFIVQHILNHSNNAYLNIWVCKTVSPIRSYFLKYGPESDLFEEIGRINLVKEEFPIGSLLLPKILKYTCILS